MECQKQKNNYHRLYVLISFIWDDYVDFYSDFDIVMQQLSGHFAEIMRP